MQPPAGSQVSRVPAQRAPSEQLPPAPLTPEPQPPRRRMRTVLTVVAGVLAVLCLGGLITGLVLYNRAAAPDRSAPDVVVDNYLRAFLVDRNDARADLFTCKRGADLQAVQDLRVETEQRESKFGVTVRVSWGPLTRTPSSGGESVGTTLTIAGSADGVPRSSRREDWTFSVVEDDDGWRVCGGTRAS
ncbi:hypothetical protein [Micromonospora parathelypteridis]|uniref:hypothetical protein n=1 Tax=Micromonospora parathelypteridis TaxID=1839617 RepID=UPI00161871A4|nr:hypothetical protein [Micromonospora parathelypteridis]GGO12850.1 hypothetical protein GCM10011576_22430 [Micromonospora parathelypteridis]